MGNACVAEVGGEFCFSHEHSLQFGIPEASGHRVLPDQTW